LSLFVKVKQTLVVSTLAVLVAMAAIAFTPVSAVAQSSGDRKVKQKVSPTYPELARHANISGTVKLEATISSNGSVKSVKVLGGHPLLAGAAEDALRKWKYEPGTGESTEVIEFHFNPGM